MRALRYLAGVFVDAFGITHPSIEGRDQAARYIALLMILLFLLLCGAIAFAVGALHT